MTTVCAAWTAHGAAIASDRRACFGGEARRLAAPKIRQVAPWLVVGVSGTGPDLTWRDSLVAPDDVSDISAAAAWLTETWAAREDDRDRRGVALALTPWGIIEIDDSGTAWPYDASETTAGIGSGGGYAIGAIHVALADGTSPADAAHLGVHVAARHDISTGDGIDVLTIEVAP